MITPRETFKKSSLSKDWNGIVDSTRFEMAATAALAQMEIDIGSAPDIQSAAASHYRMQGAKQLLQSLSNLARDTVVPRSPTSKNLLKI